MAKTSEVDRLLKMVNSIKREPPTSTDVSEGGYYVPPGTLLYASPTGHLLNNQYLHKSVVLILSNDPVATVGVVLNRPTPNGIEVDVPNSGPVVLPVLFGGGFKVKTEPGVIWLHNSKKLKALGIGSSIGINHGTSYFKITSKEAITCVAKGVCGVEDFVVISGVSVWTKGEKGIVRGIEGEVVKGKFNVCQGGGHEKLVWGEIRGQAVMKKDRVYRTSLKSEECWRKAVEGKGEIEEGGNCMVWGENVTEEWVGDEGLRNWGRMFMVGFEDEEDGEEPKLNIEE